MASYYGKSFDDTHRDLRIKLPVEFPVRLETTSIKRVTKLSDADNGDQSYGLTVIDEDKAGNPINAIIYIARNLPKELAEYILVHEWAHIIQTGAKYKEHGDYSFGIAYAKCWRVYIGED